MEFTSEEIQDGFLKKVSGMRGGEVNIPACGYCLTPITPGTIGECKLGLDGVAKVRLVCEACNKASEFKFEVK